MQDTAEQFTPEPPFGRRARLWFRRRLWHYLEQLDRYSDETLRALVAWYEAQHDLYVAWVPEETFGGAGFRAGEWRLREDAVIRDLQIGLVEIAVDRMTSLDEWLAADLAGALPVGASHPGGTTKLDEATRAALSARTRRRSGCWPKACSSCGESFTPERHRARRCTGCRKAKRGKSSSV